jgi:uncharacterized FlgJ-related protein
MVYRLSKKTLKFENINGRVALYFILTIIISITISLYSGYRLGKNDRLDLTENEKLIIIQEYNQFTQIKLIDKLKELNVKFPWIALAQSIQETGNYTSKVFKENNNLFGMKEAKQRITTSKGTENNHAYYTTWVESLQDYAFYQCRFLSNINTEEQYFQYLEQSYAEDINYVKRIKDIIQKNNLKSKFN